MKKYTLLLALLFFKATFAQVPQIQWSKCYGGSANDRANASIAAQDSGYIMCGFTSSTDGDVTFNHGAEDGWIVKTDAEGNIQWQKSYGGSGSDIFNSIIPIPGDGYIVCGQTSSSDGDVLFNHGLYDFWAVKIDESGNIIWQNTYGGSDNDMAAGIAKSDSGYFIVGQTFSDDGDISSYKAEGDGWLVSIDNSGNLLDQKTKGGSKSDIYNSIITSTYGGFLICGTSYSDDGSLNGLSHGGSDAWFTKISKTGSLQWTYCYGGTLDDGALKVMQSQDGNYAATGWFEEGIDQDSWFFSLDVDGNLVSDKKYGGDSAEYAGSLLQNYTNTFVLAGTSASPVSGDVTTHIGGEDIWLYEGETTDGLNWQKSMGGTANERATGCFLNADTSFMVAGYTNSNDVDVSGNHGDYDWWLVKLNPGCSVHASFTYSNVANVVTFSNGSTNDSAWYWTFGDGTTSTEENPVHEFPAGVGSYEVCLAASAGNCVPDTFCTTVYICGDPAVASFNYTVSGNNGIFANTSTHATVWSWSFGDGTFSTDKNPTHSYSSNGTFEVCLVAIYVGCSSDTVCENVTICNFATEAQFSYTVDGGTADFTNSSTPANTYYWTFGDGGTSTAENPSHNYTASGTYDACLVIDDGCSLDTTCSSIVICLPAVPDFEFFISNYLTANFIDESENATGWQWSFGDGGTSTTPNPAHTYTLAGTYEVCLIATNTCGSDTLCQDVTVTCPPFDGNYNFTQSNDTAFFSDQSSASANSWNWDFGDGATSTDENPTHIYTQNGVFTACLVVSDGCTTDTICQQITVIGVSTEPLEGMDNSFSIYPNPFSSATSIKFTLSKSSQVKMDLLDLNGKMLKTITDRNFAAGNHQVPLEKEALASGIYLLKISSANGISMLKLMVE